MAADRAKKRRKNIENEDIILLTRALCNKSVKKWVYKNGGYRTDCGGEGVSTCT